MRKRNIVVVVILLLVVGVIVFVYRADQGMNSGGAGVVTPTQAIYSVPWVTPTPGSFLPPTQSYRVMDSSFSPHIKNAVTQVEFIRATSDYDGHTWQKFVIKNAVDGRERELVTKVWDDVQFEKISPDNWSPSNRFVFVYTDSPVKRDVVFFQTDGRFTNAKYYLQSTGIYPNLSVTKAFWMSPVELGLEMMDLKTHARESYVVDFDNSVGVVMPAGQN